MADYNLKDRQDLPVWNALEANNVKQALKLIDKRLAKKRTDRLEVSIKAQRRSYNKPEAHVTSLDTNISAGSQNLCPFPFAATC